MFKPHKIFPFGLFYLALVCHLSLTIYHPCCLILKAVQNLAVVLGCTGQWQCSVSGLTKISAAFLRRFWIIDANVNMPNSQQRGLLEVNSRLSCAFAGQLKETGSWWKKKKRRWDHISPPWVCLHWEMAKAPSSTAHHCSICLLERSCYYPWLTKLAVIFFQVQQAGTMHTTPFANISSWYIRSKQKESSEKLIRALLLYVKFGFNFRSGWVKGSWNVLSV